jgi:hypothetical protein
VKASNSSDGKYDEYLRKGMRNSTHIVPLGVSETKQGLLQDRYSPGCDAALDCSITLDGFLGSGGWTIKDEGLGALHKAEAPTA